ncbi:Ribosomal RNA large subunit methyltransferase K/L [Dyadobacter sp. CECT 9623]|uniref:Ribosomal RNA large subunit methyltransferase K/L n=1 Tax=Dyadobacter linearis TaxID=2823330 RepID=A0ABM8UPA3_9BACT|nr:class I SAM-dependent methyltransferase [Dyadobacter sp. CECT 9623]CAG5069266.1 Ribosomal RNA large subunit methyltransferase K/L [Dyadobacter sp. CECT 9623]
MILLTPDQHTDYQLIDSGGFEKLERFGPYILTRPEPQAIWDKSLPESEWEERSNAVFKKDKNSQEKGQWVSKADMPEKWVFQYRTNSMHLRSKLILSSFKHVGVFPEQATNWDYIYKKVKKIPEEKLNVLNLFAYTGIASLAAKAAGADVTHVDSIKQVISWSRENMQLSGLDNIRWVVEDALKFVQREVRRGNQYNGIILDPPAYGRGPDGEKWLLEESLNEILRLCALLLKKENNFFIINLYSLGFSALIVENLINAHFGDATNHEFGELYVADSFGKKLPLGVFSRFSDQND